MKFELHMSIETGRPMEGFLREHILRAVQLIGGSIRELSVALVGNARMAGLHEEFMGLAGPTDVLTFEIEKKQAGGVVSGEVVVCVPWARKEAKEHGHAVKLEVLLYCVHGILHLSGYDDLNRRDYKKMHDMEDQLLNDMGLGRVFARDGKIGRKKEIDRATNMKRRKRAAGISHKDKMKGRRA